MPVTDAASCESWTSNNAVEVHLSSLRRKLPEGLIRNVRGLGWMIASKRADA